MHTSEINELAEKLVLMQLASRAEVDTCQAMLPERRRTPKALLDALEAKGALTSYQVGRIAKGEIQGLILGPYKLLYRNASGSFARVFRACRMSDGAMVGLKVLRQRWANDPQMVTTFHREAELGKSLQHENIVPIYEVGQAGDQHFFTMEFVEGGNLRDFVAIRGKLSPLEATKCLLEMAQGLNYAAAKGIHHRDMKLTNVLMSSHGTARLVDFGLATIPQKSLEDDEAFQRALDYATLEKGTGVPRNDPRSDLYFLGTIYYELLTGEPPLARTRNRHERGRFGRYEEVLPLERVDNSIPAPVIRMCNRLLELNPLRRYQNPGEVVFDAREAYVALGGRLNGMTDDSARAANAAQTVMFVENRVRHQDLLREYFTKHGFRVLVMGDVQRALNRLKMNPPDCVIFMGEGLGEPVVRGFREAQQLETPQPGLRILILAERQADWRSRLGKTDNSRVLVQPLPLRKLRRFIRDRLLTEDEILDADDDSDPDVDIET